MDLMLLAIFLLSGAGFIVFCKVARSSRTKGFGPYNTSTFLLLTATSMTALLAAEGKISGQDAGSIMLAIIGFAAGLFAGGKSN